MSDTRAQLKREKQRNGFTMIEVLIAIFIIGVVIVGLFGLFVLSLRTSQESERRVVGVALANEKMEMVRNLPYAKVGTVGGIPSGPLLQQESIVRNGLTYTVRTDIRYVDDPYDGSTGTDLYTADYKQARIQVTWNSPQAVSPVLMITFIAPLGVEGGQAGGTLDFRAVNATGQAVAGATVHITNSQVNPAIDLTTQTNNAGQVLLPGAPESHDSYHLSVTYPGYTTEQTYPPTSTFIPNTDHSPFSLIQQQVTSKTFVIDAVSGLTLTTQNATGGSMANIAYRLKGTKTIGVDNTNQPVYVLNAADTTGSNGQHAYTNLVWDSYALTIDGVATGYDIKETSSLLPLTLSPGQNANVAVTLVPHQPYSLHVSVTSPTGEAVNNATVHVTGNGYDQTLGTGVPGQVFFSPLPSGGSYTVVVDAPGYDSLQQSVTVTASDRVRIQLTSH